MSVVPHTKTHAVNLPDLVRNGDEEAISHEDLWDVWEPVQIISDRNGQTDTNRFSYSGPIFDLNQLIESAGYNRGRLMNPYTRRQIGYEDLDAVQWTGLPSSITSSPGNYVQRTERHLAQLRAMPPAVAPQITHGPNDLHPLEWLEHGPAIVAQIQAIARERELAAERAPYQEPVLSDYEVRREAAINAQAAEYWNRNRARHIARETAYAERLARARDPSDPNYNRSEDIRQRANAYFAAEEARRAVARRRLDSQ